MTTPLDHMRALRHSAEIRFPLAYPDPDARFYGYVDEDAANPTAALVTLIRAIAAQGLGSVTLDAQWASWVELLLGKCEEAWLGRVPPSPKAQKLLRKLCQETLAYENLYLAHHLPLPDNG